jgi:group I intron endonuclease
MKMTCIYIISSKIKPGRIYIGSALNFKARKAVHLSELKGKYHHCKKLQRHVNKYGIEDLSFEIVEKVNDKPLLLVAEQSFINMFNPYFNSNPTAGSNLGKKFGPMTEAHKEKIRKGNLGKVVAEEVKELHRVKVSKYSIDGELLKTYMSWTHAALEEGLRIRKSGNRNVTIGGYVWVGENEPLPDFNKLKSRLGECRKVLCKPVLQIDTNGNLVAEFEGVRIAHAKTGIDHRSIAAVAAGTHPTRKRAGGYIWKYKDQ